MTARRISAGSGILAAIVAIWGREGEIAAQLRFVIGNDDLYKDITLSFWSVERMATFDEREKGFEAKFRRDEEFRFKVIARRNKLLGLWAAELLGLEGEAAEVYAKEVVKSDFEKPGDDDVLEKVHGDLSGKGVATSAHIVRKKMEELIAVASDQFKEEI